MVIKVLYADIAVSTMLSLAVFQQPTNVAETVHLPHLILRVCFILFLSPFFFCFV